MSKEKIIFLHGALGSRKNFDDLVEICSAEFECTLLDFPGHGENERVIDFSIEKLSYYLIEYISTHFDTPVSIFGYSMGGYIALHALTQRPQLFNKIFTLATKFHWNEIEAEMQISKLNAAKIEAKLPHFVDSLVNLHPAHHWKNVIKNMVDIIGKLGKRAPLDIELLSKIDNPILIGLGDQDNMVTLSETENLFRQLQNGSMYLIPNMQHPIEKMNVKLIYEMMKHFF